jgi:hypothetical protein
MTVLDQVAEMLLQSISAHTRTAGKISYAASTRGLNGALSTGITTAISIRNTWRVLDWPMIWGMLGNDPDGRAAIDQG